jgi:predicted O-methyltransferase YrrM
MPLQKIKHTYKDIQGWFNMEKQYLYLLENTPENGVFVELGTWKGKSTTFLVTEMINRGRNVNFYAVDLFETGDGIKDEKEINAYGKHFSILDEYKNNTKHISSYYNTIISDSSKAASSFEDESVDVIFIDAGHTYDSVKSDILSWLPKIKKGGIISGHDYRESWKDDVIKAVQEILGEPDFVENSCWFKKNI